MINRLIVFCIFIFSSTLSTSASFAEEDSLILMQTDLEPYVSMQGDVATGFLADYLQKAANEAHVKIMWNRVHWDKQIPLLKDNRGSICSVALYKTEERKKYIRFSAIIGFDEGLVLVGKHNNQRLTEHKSFKSVIEDKGLAPILERHTVYTPYVNKIIAGKNLPTTKASLERIARIIKSGTRDFMILTKPSAKTFSQRYDLSIYDHYRDMAEKIPFYLACNRSVNALLFERINAEFTRMGPAN